MIEQSEIDALLASAAALAADADGKSSGAPAATSRAAAPPAPPAPQPPRDRSAGNFSGKDDLQRILRLRVPILVQLAERQLSFKEVLGLTVGSVIEFERPSDSNLDLIVGNRKVGNGQAVKVGENFGLRICELADPRACIQAMGAPEA